MIRILCLSLLLFPLLTGCQEEKIKSPSIRTIDMLQTQTQFTTNSGSLRLGRK